MQLKLLTAILMASAATLSAQTAENAAEFHASNELSAVYNEVDGAGKAASSLTKGLNYLDMLNLYGNGKKSGWDYNYAMGIKATDDRAYDAKTVSLVNLNGRATNGAHTVNLGDTFETFSQYALATSLKGGSYKFARQDSKLPEVTAVFGWAYPRWDSVWNDPASRSVKRQGTGVRVKEDILPDLWAGLSYVGAKDTGRINPTDALYDSSNYTLDFGYAPIPGLTMNGERSQSDSDEATSGVSAKGSATRFEITGDADPSRVTLEYEKVDPDFLSALGSATPDRRKFKAKWRYKYDKRITVTSGLLWYRNNLEGDTAAGTTRSWKPEVGVAIKKPFASRPDSFTNLTYRFDRRYGAGSSASDHYLNANYRDRLGEIDSDSNLGFTLYRTEADVRDASEITFNTAFSSRYTVNETVLKPALNLGTWYSRDDLADTTDKIYEYSLGLGLEAPAASLTGDLRAGQNILHKEGADDSNRFFAALSAYWRPKLVARLSESTVFLRANFNDFSFSTANRNFREKSVTLGLNTAF